MEQDEEKLEMRCFITLLLLLVTLTGHTQIVIDGQIKNYDGKTKVYYVPTIEGISSTSFETTPSQNGNFRIRYKNEGYGTCRINFSGISFSFIHTSKAEIRFSIDQSKIKFPKKGNRSRFDHIHDSVKQIATDFIDGDLAEINRFNNKTIRSSTRVFSVDGCDYSILIKEAETPERVVSIIDSLIQRELTQINQLGITPNETPNSLNLKSDIKKFLANQVYSFYANVFLNGMMLKRHEQGRKLIQEPNAPLLIYNPAWESLIETYFRNASKNIQPAANTFEFNELVLNMAYTLKDYKKYDFDPSTTTDDELVIERLLNPDLRTIDSLSLIDEKGVFAYQLFNLARFLQTQTFYSPVLLNAINEFKIKHPTSMHIIEFEPQIESLKKYLKSGSMQFDKAVILETNYIRFEDLVGRFKGKNILIDIWATWCGPCVEDFNYKSKLRPFIESAEISILYISIDKPVWEKKWKENMRFNQLDGYHVLANDLLIEDMWKNLKGTQGAIPRYALIAKNGKIVLYEASRPSQGDKLIKEIEAFLNK
jgi:thiol-disulfide isomerase/thioredoxin